MWMKSALLLLCLFAVKETAELEKRTVLDGKVELLLPKDWKPMKEELIRKKYPGARPPKLVYSDISGAVSIAFNHTDSKANAATLEKYKEVLKEGLKSAYPDATWEEEGIRELNGKKVGYFKVTTDTPDDRIYNYMLFTDLNGTLLICSFNCTQGRLKTWKPLAEQIMGSLTFKD